jgi:hypothetical protein
VKFAHVINPVKVSKEFDLYQAQPVTFSTMINAKSQSSHAGEIEQYAVGFKEDEEIFPSQFIPLRTLKRSVLDVGKFCNERKLPLIADILSALEDINNVDYVIYTNSDIALMPFFYNYIITKIESGSDSLIINRRVIPCITDLPLMYADVGVSHPGYDCFVFRKELLKKLILGKTCIGANWIGRAMLANLIVFSKNVEIIKDGHLTFHIGDDGAWLKNDYSEFDIHNKKQAYEIISHLRSTTNDEKIITDLNDITQYMDNWGKPVSSNPEKSKKVSLLNKIRFTITKFFK